MDQHAHQHIEFGPGDALIIVDVQNDFLPGGALAVPRGNEVIPVLNDYIAEFRNRGLPIVATRDWHPRNHCSFKSQGGPWPVHCVVGTHGAQFSPALNLPRTTIVVSKPNDATRETYDAFEGTDLEKLLRRANVERLFVGGLATDYCVFHTAKAGLARDFQVLLLTDAIRAVNIHPDDGAQAERQMLRLGMVPFELKELVA